MLCLKSLKCKQPHAHFQAADSLTSMRRLQSGIDVANVKMSMNPFCEIAVEVRHAATFQQIHLLVLLYLFLS